jgi:hypothetical protein
MDDFDLSERLADAGWQTFEEAFGEQADLARELAGEHRAHRMGEFISPSLADLVRRQMRSLVEKRCAPPKVIPLTPAELSWVAGLPHPESAP